MNSSEILFTYIKKLCHPMIEIRERSLQLLKAKLDLGWEIDDVLDGTRRLIEALLNWFEVPQPTFQKEVLDLLLKALKTHNGTYIVKEIGIKHLIHKLISYKDKIESHALDTYEDVLDTLKFLNTVQSSESVAVPQLNLQSVTRSESDSNIMSSKSSLISIEENEVNRSSTKAPEGVRVLLFPWAKLSPSDTKTIILLEDALKLLKSIRKCCRFIRDVFLRDFPPEIFLNRSAIVESLIAVATGNDGGKHFEPLHVLLCITKALCTRLRQLSSLELIQEDDKVVDDLVNDDVIDGMNKQLEEITQCNRLTYASVKEDGLVMLKQLPAPMYATDLLHAILSKMARNVILQDPKSTENLSLNELNICICIVEWAVGLLVQCVSESFWSLEHQTKIHKDITHKSCTVMRLLGDLLCKYRSSFSEDSTRVSHRVASIRLWEVSRRLLQWSRRAVMRPTALLDAVFAVRLDPALDVFYPHLARTFDEVMQNTDIVIFKEFHNKYRELKKIFEAMEEAVKFIKNKGSCRSSKTVLKCIKDSLPALQFHLNDLYLSDITEILFIQSKSWNLDSDDWNEARGIALYLMAHPQQWVRSKFYASMAETLKNIFLKEEQADGNSLMLLCDVKVLSEICCHGLSDSCVEVESSASEIMQYLLRGRLVLSSESWWGLLACLLPTLPLLHVYAAHDTQLGQAICKSLELDIAECMGVSRADVLSGLVRLLFVKCPSVQMDAAMALCHMLDDPKWLPPKESLRADILISALQTVEPVNLNVDLDNAVNKTKSPQATNVSQMLDVLRQDIALDESGYRLVDAGHPSPALEPSLRRATLQQLAVLMLRREVHDAFLNGDGVKVVAAIFRLSLLVDDYLAFPECAISCVSILNSICYDSRYVLAKVPDLPALLLRAILIFPSDQALVQMSFQVLAVLVWDGFVLQDLDSSRKRVLALPANIVARTCLPFPVQAYWNTSSNRVHSSAEWLQSEEEWRAPLRVRWSLAWNPIQRVLYEGASGPGPLLLRVTPHDVASLQAACPLYSMSAALTHLKNATSHSQVYDSLAILESYTHLVKVSSVRLTELSSLPWRGALSRFMDAPPASPRDVALLTALLRFLVTYMDEMPGEGGTKHWIKTSFMDSETTMIGLLSRDQLFPQQSQQDTIDIIQLHIQIVKVMTRCVVAMELSGGEGWQAEGLLNILLACLDKIDMKNFHTLGYLSELVRCIRYTLNSTWCSVSEDAAVRGVAATCGVLRGAGCKGNSWRLDGALAVLAAVRLLKDGGVPAQRWSDCFAGGAIRALWSAVARGLAGQRAAAAAVLAALALQPALLSAVAEQVPGESLAQFALETFTNRGEAVLVRANALKLLTSLTARVTPFSDVNEIEIFRQLKLYNFFDCCMEELTMFCENNNDNNNFIEPNIPLSLLERRFEYEVRASKTSDIRISPTPFVPATKPTPTPSLIIAVADLLYNLCGFNRFPIQPVNEMGLFRLMFRSLRAAGSLEPLRCAASRTLARYADQHAAVRGQLLGALDCVAGLLDGLAPLDTDANEDKISAHTQSLLLLATLLRERATAPRILRELREQHASTLLNLLLQTLEFDDSESDLLDAGLYCLCQLTQAMKQKKFTEGTTNGAWSNYLDNIPSPYYHERTPRADDVISVGDNPDNYCQPEYMTEEFCKCLLLLYQKYSLENQKFEASPDCKWIRICSCLSSLLAVSSRARHYGSHRGFARDLLSSLQRLRDHLSIHGKPIETLKNTSSSPLLLSLYWMLTLMTCFMVECRSVKESFANNGVALSLNRLWPWCMMTEQLRGAVLHFLCVFTNECPVAWNAMSTCVGGHSLVAGVCALVSRDSSRRAAAATLPRALAVLTHCAPHQHCRTAIKTEVLSHITKSRTLPNASRLLEALCRHPDAAARLLELRPPPACPPALAHAAHHHPSTVLRSPELLEAVSGSLLIGDIGDMVAAGRAVWAMAANNHRAKLALRSAGVTAAVLTALERLHRLPRDANLDRALQLLTYTNNVLQTT